jgi:HSP20 family molecular chaperone IbpA
MPPQFQQRFRAFENRTKSQLIVAKAMEVIEVRCENLAGVRRRVRVCAVNRFLYERQIASVLHGTSPLQSPAVSLPDAHRMSVAVGLNTAKVLNLVKQPCNDRQEQRPCERIRDAALAQEGADAFNALTGATPHEIRRYTMSWNHLGPLWQAQRFERSLQSSWNAPTSIGWDDAPEAVTYRVRVPGYRRKDLAVEVRARQIVVRGERARGVLGPKAKSSFVYSMTLPETLDEGNVSAELRRGVLCMTVAKKPYARARRIPVSVRGKTTDVGRERDQQNEQGPTVGRRILAWLRDALAHRAIGDAIERSP